MSQKTPMDPRILDRLAARCAGEIVAGTIPAQAAKDVDILVTKALGVLQENGVYACFLFLLSRTQDKEQKISKVVRGKLLDMIGGQDLNFADWHEHLPPDDGRDAEAVLAYVANTVCAHLDPLLMTKEVLEQTLIYARYGAKARKNEGK